MHKFEIQLISEAFNRCYGLAGFILKEDKQGIDILAQQTGMRSDYLQRNQKEVIQLANQFNDDKVKK